jgi:hypothetical protein
MPFLKLWNSLRGLARPAVSTETSSTIPVTADHPVNPTVKVAARQEQRDKTSSGWSLFGGGPHSGLCKQLKGVSVTSLLEISVDDGSRAIAILEALQASQQSARYSAIDTFEMGGGRLTLKQFHQRLRAQGIRPQLFPATIDLGLMRVAQTIGPVDLIVIGAAIEHWQTVNTLPLLPRVSHNKTLILYRDGEQWKRYQVEARGSWVRQRAA